MENSQNPLCLIALSGKAGSGKSTVASFLSLYYGFKVVALADGVRSALDDLDGPTWEHRKQRGAAGMTERKAIQLLGSEARERLSGISAKTHWLDHLMVKVRYCSEFNPVKCFRFVVPDLRFPHEDTYFRMEIGASMGFYESWLITRPEAANIAESSHVSEIEYKKINHDRGILNNGTLENLHYNCARILTHFSVKSGVNF